MQNVLNLDALAASSLKTDPYPYFTVAEAIDSAQISRIIDEFPAINDGGSYNIEDVETSPAFQSLLDSIDTPAFRRIICDKFDVEVMDLPMMMTLRGYSRKKDGRIHTDSKTKVATILIYLNHDWPAETGRLRVLRSADDIDDYVEEIMPGPGSLMAFKVTDNCWHGYPSFEGQRQSIQINFLTSEAAGNKHRFFHRLSAKLKSLFK